MVKVTGESSGLGPDYKATQYKYDPNSQYKYTGYSGQHTDYVQNKDYFKPTQFKPTPQNYEYKQYKPSNVGIYGEKPREKTVHPKPNPQPVRHREPKPVRTFESYRWPKGPDIKHSEYKPSSYQPSAFKPTTPVQHRFYGNNTVKAPPSYIDTHKGLEKYPRPPSYKLTEENYAGKNNWKSGFVNDPITAKSSGGTPEERYKVQKKPQTPEKKTVSKPAEKPKQENPTVKKAAAVKDAPLGPVAAIVPVPVDTRKSYKSTGTQPVLPQLKTSNTQTTVATKTSGTQYDNVPSSVTAVQTESWEPASNIPPMVVPAPIPPIQSSKRAKMKSQGVQCLDTKTKTTAKATQCNMTGLDSGISPRQQERLEPVAMETQQSELREPYRRESPVQRLAPLQRTPSPHIVPIVAVPAKRRTPSPPQQRQRTPVSKNQETPVSAKSSHPAPIIAPVIVGNNKTPATQRSKTPQYNRESPVKSAANSRWTPSPEVEKLTPVQKGVASSPPTVVPVLPAVVPPIQQPVNSTEPSQSYTKPVVPSQTPLKKSKTPKVFVSPRVQTPPPPMASSHFERQEGSGFPYQPRKPRLPPEVIACIEAYDCAHAPGSGAMPQIGSVTTMQRSGAV